MVNSIILIVILGIAAYYDWKERIVPNKLIFLGLGLGIALAIANKDYDKIVAAILVFLVLYLAFYHFKVIIPGGDIKVLVFTVLLKGSDFFITSLYTIMILTIPMWFYYYFKKNKTPKDKVIPLVVPIFIGCLYRIVGGSL